MQPIGFDGLSGNADFHVFAKKTLQRERKQENEQKTKERRQSKSKHL